MGLDPRFLEAVVSIGVQATPQEMEKTKEPMSKSATGFLYAYPELGKTGRDAADFRLWLVTCKHVIRGIREENANEIMVRLNKSRKKEMQTFRIYFQQDRGPNWFEHPKADIAVISVSPEELEKRGVQWATFAAGRDTLRREKVIEAGLSEGDEVLVLGFPVGWRLAKQDYPIVRHGLLAQVQGWFNEEHDTFLIDGSIFPGNSGGPVVTKPEVRQDAYIALGRSGLIGMALGFWPYQTENADLGVVVPMELIDETINNVQQAGL